MTFTSLASSSGGNCYIASDGKTAVLLECGISYRRIQKGLHFDLTAIRGCLVSHEHNDHSKSVMELIRSGVEVFASDGTAHALDCGLISVIEDRVQFPVGSFEIVPFETFHDAEEPLGFLLYSRVDGERLAFATDTVNLGYQFPGVNLLALEANYDVAILARCGQLSEKVRDRITNSHMEIGTLCRYLKSLDLSSCRAVYLLHLSNTTSNEADFIKRVREVVPPHIQVVACKE